MLFSDIERTDTGSRTYSEPQYAYLNRSARLAAEKVRSCLEMWFSHYPDSERKAFLSALQSPIDMQFVAAAFELYLHELMWRLGYQIKVHPDNPTGKPSRPDFLATCPNYAQLYVEAVVASETSKEERGAAARMNAVYDAINQLGPTDFFLGMDLRGSPDSPPPAKKLRKDLSIWLTGLDAEAVSIDVKSYGKSAYPSFLFEFEGWQIEFLAMPKSERNRGKPGIRPIGIKINGVKEVSSWKAIRDAIKRKGSKYGELPDSLVVAVNLSRFYVDDIEIEQALFGQEQFFLSPHDDDPNAEFEMVRAQNGVWMSASGPRYRRISAVLVVPELDPWFMAVRSARLYHNPWAYHKCVGPICSLPQCVVEDNKLKYLSGAEPREILGLPVGWPK